MAGPLANRHSEPAPRCDAQATLYNGAMPSRSPITLVSLALAGFAANSLLCRVALRPPASIDPFTFTTIRLASGAVVLLAIAATKRGTGASRGNWPSSIALFLYAIAFSVAYVRMTAGIGALILFTAVQLTMIGGGIRSGERLTPLQWLGLVLALAGLVVLTSRGVTAPDPLSAVLMSVAGVSWGVYSLRGRRSSQPLGDTAGNFARASPFAIGATLVALPGLHASPSGTLFAAASGALASGLGYSIWYAALPRLTATRASIVQLAVPVAAAAGGIAFLGEHATMRLVVATVVILSGISLAMLTRRRRS